MRKFIGRILAWIGGLTVAFFILVFVIATFTRSTTAKIPSKTILEVIGPAEELLAVLRHPRGAALPR